MGCVDGLELREEKRGRPGDCFQRPKTSDEKTGYIAAIVIRWGVKQTPNAMKLGRRPTDNTTNRMPTFNPF